MKKILVLTSIYPGDDVPKGFTSVVHYFTKEWVKMGYFVRVIHCCTYFPSAYYMAPKWLRDMVQNRFGIALPEKRLDKELEYDIEGVSVYRLPMKKLIPMSSFSEGTLKSACSLADKYLQEKSFIPDYIISHWVNPQLFLMSYLKHVTKAVTTMVLHETGSNISSSFANWKELVSDVDVWGYRSLPIKSNFEKEFGVKSRSFRCFSGIPEYYTNNVVHRDGVFHDRFVQVGLLMDRKFPNRTIDAINLVYKNKDYSLSFVGDGAMRDALEKQITNLDAREKIKVLGRLPRQEIIPLLDQSDVFILISRDEVFGLVYIEAMSRGCIVVASREEGMEGIIVNGKNGFLCEAGNAEELASVIVYIRSLSNQERMAISDAAIATSQLLTDVKVAKNYIETVVDYGEQLRTKGN